MAKLNYIVSTTSYTTAPFRAVWVAATANFSGTTYARVYLDGDTPPAYTALTTHPDGYKYHNFNNLAAGTYRVDYKDDNGEKYLGKYKVYAGSALTCYPEFTFSSGFSFNLQVQDNKVQITHTVGSWIGHTNADARAASTRVCSIDEGVTFKPMNFIDSSSTFGRSEWTNSELAVLDVIGTINEVQIRRDSNSCLDTWAYEVNLLQEFSSVLVDYDKTNATANGANDGTITLHVTGGSGSYTYAWEDGPTTANRTGLAPEFYTVVVTDNITGQDVTVSDIQITEPVPAPTPDTGSILEFSPLQSLYFVVDPIEPDNISSFQGLDNVMFCKQRYGLFEEGRYEQKVCKVDTPIVQFNSDFANHEVSLLDDEGNVIVMYPVSLVEDNVGRSVSYPISIQYNSTGQSRVYFAAGTPPLPLEVGDAFEVLNNLDGFNGTYTIVDIVFDTLRGFAYLVINLTYGIVDPTSAALGRFGVDAVDYNVYESQVVLTSYDDGVYQVKVRAFDTSGSGQKIAYSEPILLKEMHQDTVLVEARNVDNAFNMLWNQNYITRKRIEGLIGHRRPTGGEMSTTRNASYDLIKTSGKAIRGVLFEVIDIPPYLFEALSVIITKLDFVGINGVAYQTSESFSEPQFQDKYLLLNSNIKLEQTGWFRQYNSDDLGSPVISGGGNFVASDGGLIIST